MRDQWPSRLRARPMSADEAQRVAAWRYDGRCTASDLASAQPLIDHLDSFNEQRVWLG
jgi:hypothetical protein